MKYHVNRKLSCKPTINDVEILDIKQYILEGKTFEEYNLINDAQAKITQDPTINKCIHCDKIYSRSDSLNRHKKICKDKPEDEEDNVHKLLFLMKKQLYEQSDILVYFKNELTKRDEELAIRNKQFDDLIKIVATLNSTVNVQNNINLSTPNNKPRLSSDDIIKCLIKSNLCIPKLTKDIVFDINEHDIHTIYVSNKN
jgi:hypothetical protein